MVHFVCQLSPQHRDPRQPAEILGPGPLPIEEEEMRLENSEKENVAFSKAITKSIGLGFSAAILSVLPFGIKGDRQSGTAHHYEIKRVEERVFRPSPSYVHQSVLQPEVLSFLATKVYRKRVYMVVGVRIGHDAVIIHERGKEIGGKFSASAPGFATGIPVDLAAKIDARRRNDLYQREHLPDSFVFAYRLREIRYFKKSKRTQDISYIKDADLLHDIRSNKVSPRPVIPETKYIGSADEIEIDGIAGVDLREEVENADIVDGCIIVE
jgi:hypothetical protein